MIGQTSGSSRHPFHTQLVDHTPAFRVLARNETRAQDRMKGHADQVLGRPRQLPARQQSARMVVHHPAQHAFLRPAQTVARSRGRGQRACLTSAWASAAPEMISASAVVPNSFFMALAPFGASITAARRRAGCGRWIGNARVVLPFPMEAQAEARHRISRNQRWRPLVRHQGMPLQCRAPAEA